MTAKAEDTLSGIQTLVRDMQVRENPYTILEIVPDAADAEIGYYIEGNEPILSQRLEDGRWLSWQERLAGIETKQERLEFMSETMQSLQDFYNVRFPGLSIMQGAEEVPISYVEYSESKTPIDGGSQINIPERSKNGVFRYTEDTTLVRYKIQFDYATHTQDDLKLDNPATQYYYPVAELITSTNMNSILPETMVYTLQNPGIVNLEKFVEEDTWGNLKGSVSGGDNGGVSGNAAGSVSGSDLGVDYYVVKFVPWDNTVTGLPYYSLYVPGQIVQDPAGSYEFVEGAGEFPVIFPAETVYYTGGFINNDWFARKVINLDPDQVSGFKMKVITMTAYEVAAATGFVETNKERDYDLLYLASGRQMLPASDTTPLSYNDYLYDADGNPIMNADGTAQMVNDISAAMRDYLFDYTVSNGLPCIVDASIVYDPTATDGASADYDHTQVLGTDCTNIFYLALEFMQASPSQLYEESQAAGYAAPAWADLLNAITDSDKNYVTEQVYSFYRPYTLIGPAFFTDMYYINGVAQGAKADGFSPVIDEINAENLNREADISGEFPQLPTDVSQATIVRHIINYKNRSQTLLKDTLHVLDIEPCLTDENSYELTEDMVRVWALGADADDVERELTIVIDHMTTAEFIGKIDDINESYDLVYIGTSTAYMNIDANGSTVFNDSGMNGLIYFHTGDQRIANAELAGQLASEKKDSNTVFSYNRVRYSGNDITKQKRDELLSFLDASYPIVVSDSLFTTQGGTSDDAGTIRVVDADIVDCTSYMYEFLDAAQKRGNFYTESDVPRESGMFGFYLNRPKIEFVQTHFGTDTYAPGYDGIYLLNQDVNGRYLLEYRFMIVNEGAASVQTRYQCQLFADSDADGRFSASEELGDISITQNGNVVAFDQLYAGREYVLTRSVPNEYAGLLPWKVEVTQVGNPNIHNGWIGYTKLKGLERERVKILQITRNPLNDNEKLFNLQERVESPTDIYHKLVYGSFDAEDRDEYTGIYADFDISVTTMTLNEYINEYVNVNSDILNEYNMLILGFAEGYNDIPNNEHGYTNDMGALDAIRDYVISGRSVLFTNDTVSYVNYKPGTQQIDRNGAHRTNIGNERYNTYEVTKTFRALVGMERYGNGKDKAYAPKNNNFVDTGFSQGYTYSIINAMSDHSISYPGEVVGTSETCSNDYLNMNYGTVYYNDTSFDNGAIPNRFGEVDALQVTQVNAGQITEYPYRLEETLNVSPTHAQYYQLDFATDEDKDNKSDVVVWYCLGGRSRSADGQKTIYSMSPNDVTNNYFIYNKGNVTYTSMGYSGDNSTVDEAKLFINTMIAAFRAGVKNPTVTVLNGGTKDAAEITSVNRYHDDTSYTSEEGYDDGKDLSELGNPNDGSRNDTFEKVYFKVNDPNFIKGTRKISLRLYEDVYVADSSNPPAGLMSDFTYEGKTVFYKPITGRNVAGVEVQIPIRKASNNEEVSEDELISGEIYYILIPKDKVTKAEKRYSVYFEVWSRLTNYNQTVETGKGYQRFDFTKVQLFDLE